MTQQEHLNRIRARCVELLEIADKRTAGTWKPSFDTTGFPCVATSDNGRVVITDLSCSRFGVRQDDAIFIASCAGAAEAGWKATIAAIDNIGEIRRHYSEKHNTLLCALLDEQKAAIIASWPAELL